METRKRRSNRRGRLWAAALAATLACALLFGAVAQAAPATGAVIVPDEASPKPVVTIQGNVVVDKGKPTGFYELALCVRTARIVTRKDTGAVVADQVFVDALNAAAEGDEDALPDFYAAYNVQRFPFQSAAATVHVDLDALTAVTWGAGTPVYADWSPGAVSGSGTYAKSDTGYPRGLDLSGAEEQPDIFTNLDKIINGTAASVRLDTANPDEMTNATALIESYDAANRTALLTLSANTTNTANVVYDVDTPVVVVRFSYDLDRFRETDVLTQPNQSDFWLGLDRNDASATGPVTTGQKALTFLGAGNQLNGDYTASDAQAAGASIHQSVWYAHNLLNDQVGQKATNFYYYLGAETFANQGTGTYTIIDNNAVVTPSPTLSVPKTQGNAVLAKHSDAWPTTGDPDAASGFSFYQNLLTMKEGTLKLELVNAETYRKPAGGGGITIRLLDWDGTDIGSLVVSGGDVRAELEEYIEENLVHPDLRPSDAIEAMGGKLPEDIDAAIAAGDTNAADYRTLVTSLERDYTYRGKYAYTVGAPDVVGDDGDTSNKARANGEDFPLTNKLDYVFTKRVNTAAEYSVTDPAGTHRETYVLPHQVTDVDMVDADLYPYVYGWAVVEDTSAKNSKNWKYMYDAAQEENVWTTVGVGELSSVDPAYYDDTTAVDNPLPTALGNATFQAPAFLVDEDPYWIDHVNETPQPGMNYTDKYAYSLNSNGAESYFRFADFSDIDAELERYTKSNGTRKDTLIVKAVFEPGASLVPDKPYRLAKEPYYNKMNALSSGEGAAYSVEMVLERVNTDLGPVQGTSRLRLPAIRQDTTADNRWLNDDRIPEHDANNADLETARAKTETSYVQAQMVDGDTLTYTITLGARHNKVDSFLIERYGLNYVVGGQRSETNFNREGGYRVLDNYNYYHPIDSNTDDGYYDVQNYAEKEGSRGFVLQATLNSIMEQATRCNRGIITTSEFAEYAKEENLIDINLRTAGGALPAWDNASSLRTAIRNAARDCENNHKGDPAYWNSERDCAQINYHMLQRYIITGSLPADETDDENPGTAISWCHLHKACAASVSNKPKNWGELIDKAKDNALDDIKDLLLDELQAMTRLRMNLSGAEYADRDLLAENIVEAVQAGCESWNDIQYYLIHKASPVTDEEKAEANARYWWYDGAESNPTPSDLPALLTAVKTAADPPLIPPPDGDLTPRFSKLYGVKAIVEDNAIQSGEAITAQWRRLTHNLVADADENGAPIRFTDYDQFIAALVDVMRKRPSLTGADKDSWTTIQRLILEAAAAPNEPTTTDYYWYDGARRITNLAELAAAAQEKLSGDPTLWDSLTQEAFLKFADPAQDPFWYFADDFNMTRFLDFTSTADYEAFLALVLDWAGQPGANLGANPDTSWAELQYMLAHGGSFNSTNAVNEFANGFYWWKGGVTTPPTYDLSSVESILTNAAGAAFASKINGNTHAWDSLTQETLDQLNLKALTDADAVNWGFENFTGTPKPVLNGTTIDDQHMNRDAMPNVTVEQFKTAVEGMVQSYLDEQVAAGNGHGHEMPPVVKTREIQYAIINNGAYVRETTMPQISVGTYTGRNGYWWLTQADAPNPWTPPKVEVETSAEWKAFIAKLAANPDASTVVATDLTDINVHLSANGAKWTNTTAKTLKAAKTKLALATSGILAAGGRVEDLTWYELQHALATSTYLPNAQAVQHSQKDTWNTWAPEWVIQKWDPDYEP